MTPLEAIEERFEFSYPTLYKQLYTEGLLDIGQFGPQWMTSEFPRLRLRPPLLLFGHDFELMQLEDIAEETAEFFNPDSYREVRPGLRFVPFAMTGGGDLYCFHLNAATEADVPVVYVWHDADEATFQAKNLQDFIFRGLLEAVVGIDKESLIATDDLSENCRAMLATHGPFLSPRQRQLVENLYARDVTGYTSKLPNGREYQTRGLLSPDELAQILRAEIGFEHLDRRFGYMREE